MTISASGTQNLIATTGLAATFTWCGWCISTVTDKVFVSLEGTVGTTYAGQFYARVGDGLFEFFADGTAGVTTTRPSTAWTFLAMSVTNSTANGGLLYSRVPNSGLLLEGTYSTPNVTPTQYTLFNQGDLGFPATGSIIYAKLFDRALSATEIYRESLVGEPVVRDSINRFIPILSASNPGTDWGPRGNNMTVTGTFGEFGSLAQVPLRARGALPLKRLAA